MDANAQNMLDLHRTISAAFRGALAQAAPSEWQRIATRMTSGSSSNLYPFMKGLNGMREWTGPAVFQQLSSGRYAIDNRLFQDGFTVERDVVDDDQDGGAGLYSGFATNLAAACSTHADELVIGEGLNNADTLLCHDGQPMIDDAHPNQNDDGGTQDNDMDGSGTAWYLMDTSKPLKPLIYQVRKELVFESQNSPASDSYFVDRQNRYNAWCRDAVGFGPWWTMVKSKQTLDETNFVAARLRLEGFHMGLKDQLTGKYRPARNKATLLVVPTSLRDTATKLFKQTHLASGESNYLLDAVPVMVSSYLD